MSQRPSIEQVRELPPVGRTEVPPSYLDENGHMNIGRYLEEAAYAIWRALADLGLGQSYIDERGLSNFTAEQHITYLSELRLGDVLSVHVQLLARSDRALHAIAYIVDDTHERLSCIFESSFVHVDMTERRSAPFPSDIAAILDEQITRGRRDWPAPVCGVMGVRKQ